MALGNWLTGLRRGWMRTAVRRTRPRTVPLATDVRTLEPRQMLSGMNAAPELITISATVDEYDASQTHVVGLFTDDVWASEYRLEIDLDADGQGDHLENITGPAFGFTTRL